MRTDKVGPESGKHPNVVLLDKLAEGIVRLECGCRLVDGEKVIDCGRHGGGRYA